jgi:hypothetical protein
MHELSELFEVTAAERALQPIREYAGDRSGSRRRLRRPTWHCECAHARKDAAADRNASCHGYAGRRFDAADHRRSPDQDIKTGEYQTL